MSIGPKIPISKAFEIPADEESPEVEGHMPRVRATATEQAEVKGHMPRLGRTHHEQAGEAGMDGQLTGDRKLAPADGTTTQQP